MTAPRPVFPGSFLFSTRRTTQRQFLLRPDRETSNAYIYCLGEAAQRFGVEVLLSQMESNHHHTSTYDPQGRDPAFHKMMAKCQNALRGRWENVWSTEEPCVVETVTSEDLLCKLVYIATNPVKDGLVEKYHHWPGPSFVRALLSGKPLKATRPKYFFRENGPMPATIELHVKLPDGFPEPQAFLAELERRIHKVEADCALERQKTGRRVLGRRAILRQSWRDSPSSREPRRVLRPRVASRDKWKRIEILQRNREWQREYRRALLAMRARLPAEFPYGTYWLATFAGVHVKPPPRPT